ncbi:MAG: LapA family protein [Deltaproteobacteria bacterium]|nr:LapA family protein [Deltaproteobacteria bacterium]
MKVVKLVVFFLVCIFLALVVIQNQSVFMDKKALELDLIVWHYQTQPIHLSLYFLGFFLIGLLVAYFHGLGERFKAKRTIASQKELIQKNQNEIAALKNRPDTDLQGLSNENNGGS